jgi:hypothetical protein
MRTVPGNAVGRPGVCSAIGGTMPDHITTYTGQWFYPTQPDPEAIHIEDIAHALPMICRGNGHVKKFFSVGEHCILCAREAQARGYSDRVVLACLLHDASECYMSDVPRPFKKMLPEYIESENRLLDLIYEKYLGSPLTDGEQKQLKGIDDDLLWYDLKYLLNEECGPQPEVHVRSSYEWIPFERVTEEYLAIFREYSSRLARMRDTDSE